MTDPRVSQLQAALAKLGGGGEIDLAAPARIVENALFVGPLSRGRDRGVRGVRLANYRALVDWHGRVYDVTGVDVRHLPSVPDLAQGRAMHAAYRARMKARRRRG